MKKIFLFFLMILSSVTHAKQLTTFAAVADAISEGKKLTLIMNIHECSAPKLPATPLLGSVQPNAFMVIDNNRITTSVKHFTLDHPLSKGNPSLEYLKFDIQADGSVSIKNTVMDATNYQTIGSHQIDCSLNKGFKAFS